jgi:hypothetical protein
LTAFHRTPLWSRPREWFLATSEKGRWEPLIGPFPLLARVDLGLQRGGVRAACGPARRLVVAAIARVAGVQVRSFALTARHWLPSMATSSAPTRSSFLPSRVQVRQPCRRGARVCVRKVALVWWSGRSFCNSPSNAT